MEVSRHSLSHWVNALVNEMIHTEMVVTANMDETMGMMIMVDDMEILW